MVKEGVPYASHEDDDEELDESFESSKKKTTKIARRMPLGLTLDSPKVEHEKQAPKLTISERLFESMGMSDKKEDDTESDEDTSEDSDLATEEPELVAPSSIDAESVPQVASEDILEATDWSSEGDLDGEAEIPLNRPVETTVSHAEKDEHKTVEESPSDFTEVSHNVETNAEPDEIEPDLLETGLGDEEPPVPPQAPEFAPPDPGEPIREQVDRVAPTAEQPWYNAAAADKARRDHEADINDAEYRGEKRGKRSGVAAGLVAGWLFGRRGKKKIAKEHVKELQTKNKEISQLQNEQLLAKQRLDTLRTNQQKIESNIAESQEKPQEVRAESRNETTQHNNVVPAERYKGESVRENTAPETLPVGLQAEKSTQHEQTTSFEQPRSSEVNHLDKTEQKELPPEEKGITEETYALKEGRHVETSAWHRIEIDEKTGKPVENPEVAYGEEFKREKRQEVIKDSRSDSAAAAGAIGALVTSVAADNDTTHQTSDHSEASSLQVNLEAPKQEKQTEHLHKTNELLRYASNPLIWATAVLVVVVLFVLGILT